MKFALSSNLNFFEYQRIQVGMNGIDFSLPRRQARKQSSYPLQAVEAIYIPL